MEDEDYEVDWQEDEDQHAPGDEMEKDSMILKYDINLKGHIFTDVFSR